MRIGCSQCRDVSFAGFVRINEIGTEPKRGVVGWCCEKRFFFTNTNTNTHIRKLPA